MRQDIAEGVANLNTLPLGWQNWGSVIEARYGRGRCQFNYSAHGVTKLGHCIVRQGIAAGVPNLTTLSTGWQNWGTV